jgi:hypothetical protein
VIADLAYGTLKGMNHFLNCGADYILCLWTNCFAMYDEKGNKLDIVGRFGGLKSGEISEAAVCVVLPDKTLIPVRICVKRKDKEGCEQSRKRPGRRASRKGNSLREETVLINFFWFNTPSFGAENWGCGGFVPPHTQIFQEEIFNTPELAPGILYSMNISL